MKCQNCGRDNAPGAEQCAVCQLPLDVDVKRSPVGGVSSNATGRPVRSIFLAFGIVLLAGTAYFVLAPAEPSAATPPEGSTVEPTDIGAPSSEPVPVQPVAEVPVSAVPTPVEVGEGGSAADRHPGDTAGTDVGVHGRLPREAIAGVMRRHMKDVRACYEEGLKRQPTLAGVVKVSFVIGPDGRVPVAHVQDSTLVDPAVTACVVKVVKMSAFPQPEGGIVRVVYPFHFAAQ